MKKFVLLFFTFSLFANNQKPLKTNLNLQPLKDCYKEAISYSKFMCGWFGSKKCKENFFDSQYKECMDSNENLMRYNKDLLNKNKIDFEDQILSIISELNKVSK